jgi:hypothetical protein
MPDDLDQGLVWGFASVSEYDGKPVVDLQGDVLGTPELQRIAHKFIGKRVGGIMHMRDSAGKPVVAGEIVESCVLSRDLQKALGVRLPHDAVPWLICMKVTNSAVRKAIARGELRGFSIAGNGFRQTIY